MGASAYDVRDFPHNRANLYQNFMRVNQVGERVLDQARNGHRSVRWKVGRGSCNIFDD